MQPQEGRFYSGSGRGRNGPVEVAVGEQGVEIFDNGAVGVRPPVSGVEKECELGISEL